SVAMQDGEDVVAVLALGLRRINLNCVIVVEELPRARPVADQIVKRRKQRRARFPVIGQSFKQRFVVGLNIPGSGPSFALVFDFYALDAPLPLKVAEARQEAGITASDEMLLNV